MQSVKTPLLVEETHSSSLSSLTIFGEETENCHLSDDIPDNRRFIQPLPSSLNATKSQTATTTTAAATTIIKSINTKTNLSKPDSLPGKSPPSTTTTNDEDDDENDDDGDPLLRDSVPPDLSLRKLPSTLFSPMSESCGSSLVDGSASGSAIATPMEISRLVLGLRAVIFVYVIRVHTFGRSNFSFLLVFCIS